MTEVKKFKKGYVNLSGWSKFMTKKFTFCLIVTFLLNTFTTAAILNVPSGLYPTIQAAINAASGSDLIVVADGTYTGPGNRDLDFGGKTIRIYSLKKNPATCIIDCNGLGRAFYFHSGEIPAAVVEGFTIKNGSEYYGGAIECEINSSPTINNCIITNSVAAYGGAIDCFYSSPVIRNCIITKNTSYLDGSAIEASSESHPTIKNCLIAENTAYGYGVIDCFDGSSPVITNCTIAGNNGDANIGGIYATDISVPTIRNCILWDNGDDIYGATATYSCIQDGDGGTGNISSNPIFKTGPLGNYYLTQTAAGQFPPDSNCVNAGIGVADDGNDANMPDTEYSITRTDNVPDTNTVDMGFHYPDSGIDANYVLIIAVEPNENLGTITIDSNLPGNDPNFIKQFTEVLLRATPSDPNYYIEKWIIDSNEIDDNNETRIVIMDANHTVVVRFSSIVMCELTTFTIDPNGSIDDYNAQPFVQHSVIDINAHPNPGYVIKRWLKGDSETFDINDANTYTQSNDSNTPYSVTLLTNTTVAVEFEPNSIKHLLNTSVTGGNGLISPRRSYWPEGSIVPLTATPDAGYKVKLWTGTNDNNSTALTNTVTMNTAKTVTVEFEAIPQYQLAISVAPNPGWGSVTPASGMFPEGTQIKLTAEPNEGYRVAGWTEDGVPVAGTWNVNTYTVTMGAANKTVTVTFELNYSRVIHVFGDVNGIQNAINQAQNGDTIRIHEGTYIGTGFVINKIITVVGDPTHPENVVIDCGGEAPANLGFVLIGDPGNPANPCTLNGVTIINSLIGYGTMGMNPIPGEDGWPTQTDHQNNPYNGNSLSLFGGAITIRGSHNVKNCIIRNCGVFGGNAGPGTPGGDPNILEDPDGGDGGWGGNAGGAGIYVQSGNPNIMNVLIEDCIAVAGDGGNGASGFSNQANLLDPGANYFPPGTSGIGGYGGDVIGAAICIRQENAHLTNVTVRNCLAISGIGGNGGTGAEDTDGGNGGLPGKVKGAGIYCSNSVPVLSGCQIENCIGVSGIGGNGGDGGPIFFAGGFGGYGGLTIEPTVAPADIKMYTSTGCAAFCDNSSAAEFINCSFTENTVYGSISGVGGRYAGSGYQEQPRKNYRMAGLGAGVFCSTASSVKFNGCHFEDNRTAYNQDFDDPNYRDLTGIDITPYGGEYTGSGGGLCLWYAFTADINECNFVLNSAPLGGSIYSEGVVDMHISDCNISNNISMAGGGVLALDSVGTISNSIIKGNIAGTQTGYYTDAGYALFGTGGGIYALNSLIDINDTFVTENYARLTGGGICFDGDTPFIQIPQIKNCLITANRAIEEGGGIAAIYYAEPKIQNCTITENIVSDVNSNGGGLFASYAANINVKDTIFWANSGIDGSQIALTNGGPFTDMPANVIIKYSDIQGSNQAAPQAIDVVFCIDTTGSMGSVLDSIKAAASDIVDRIAENTKDYRIAVVDFKDFNTSPYGGDTDYPYKDDSLFTTNKIDIQTALDGLTPAGGADWPESVYSGLMHCIDGNSLGNWRSNTKVKKIIILMGDAPPHDPEPTTGYILEDVTTVANNKNINIFSILTGGGVGDPTATYYFESLAEDSGGIMFETPDGSQAGNAVMQAIDLATRVGTPIYAEQGCTIIGLEQDANDTWIVSPDSNNIAEDPNFVFEYYLSHIATGQDIDSNCIDAGSSLASILGLDTYTTRIDGVFDSAMVDMGFHYWNAVSEHNITVKILADPNYPGIHGTMTAEPNRLVSYDANTATYKFKFYAGTAPTLTATPDVNYFVKGWYDKNNTKVSANNTFSFTVEANDTYFLRFKPEKITSVSGGGTALRNAVELAENGDTLIVAAGTYNGGINIGGKQIKLYGVNPDDPNVVEKIIIDCTGTIRGFVFSGDETAETVIDGFTIINGGGDTIEGGAIFIDTDSSPLIVNVDISNCNAGNASGGAIYISTGSNPEFRNVNITNCSATINGGGVYISTAGNPIFKNCSITDCDAGINGGAAYCRTLSSPQFINCSFSNNSADSAGAIFYETLCNVNLQGCEFTNNSANQDAGAIMCSLACIVEVNDCNFAGNNADYAGGIYIDEDCDGVIAQTSFSGNETIEDGGAIYITDSNVIEITDCNINTNTALRGGGIFTFASPKVTINNCNINSNQAYILATYLLDPTDPFSVVEDDSLIGEGGGIYAFAGPARIENCQIKFNNARTSGGGIYLSGPIDTNDVNSTLVKNCLIAQNSSGRDGGGVSVNWYANASLENCTIAYNNLTKRGYESSYGGGLYCSYASHTNVINCLIWGNTAEDGTQLAVGSGDVGYPLPATVNVTYSNIGPRFDPNYTQEALAPSLEITLTDNAVTLANAILGPGVTLVGSPGFTGSNNSAGLFKGGIAAGIKIESGIILTNGDANLALPPNNNDGSTGNNTLAGDPDLDTLVPESNTYDATILTFQFTTTGGDLYFNYIFASEEYNEFVNSPYNDIFAFFLDGQNIALIPGTTTPVAINNVNGGNPLGTNAANPYLYNNNDLTDGGPFYDIEYDGFTNMLTAQAPSLGAGIHTIKLAIADTSDYVLDSAVFIQAGTFSDTPTLVNLEPIYVEQGCTLNWDPNGGWHTLSYNSDEDPPLFIKGYYLSQVEAGQEANSPCVDTGSNLASILGFDTLTTRIDGVNDVNIVDMGYHYSHGIPPTPQYDITVKILEDPNYPSIHGTITAEPNGLVSYDANTATYTYRFDAGTIPVFTAIPDANYFVRGWYDANSTKISATESTTFIVDSNNTYFVRFKPARTIQVSGGGSALRNAVELAENGDSLIVAAGTYDGGINIGGKQIKLYGVNPDDPYIVARTIIDCNGSGRGFIFAGGETADTIVDGLTIINGGGDAIAGGAIFIDINSSPLIVNVDISDCDVTNASGGAIYISNGSNPEFRNVNITNCSATMNGGGVYISTASNPIFKNCSITDCDTGINGGAVYCRTLSSPQFTNCSFTNNYAANSAGAIFYEALCNVNLQGCEFTGNTSQNDAGAVMCGPTCAIEVNDCNFAGNDADYAGGIYINEGCDGVIARTSFSGNEATEDGGAFYITDSNAIKITDCNITENTALRGGGIFAIASPKVTITNCQINSNLAYRLETNIYYTDPNDPNTAITEYDDNFIGEGGGIYAFASINKTENCLITYNLARTSGGGIYISGEQSDQNCPLIKNCLIVSNKSSRDGGGISTNWFAATNIKNCTIAQNFVNGNGYQRALGGGIYGSYGSNTQIIDSILWSNAGAEASQIAVGSGDANNPIPSIMNVTYSDIAHPNDVGYITTGQTIRPGFNTYTLARNDDLSTELVDFGFTINFFGLLRSQCYVNNNGNITFNAPLVTFTPFGLTTNIGTPIIAPFFADVDTRAAGSNLVTYGHGTVNGRPAFGVNWLDVGYFSYYTDKLNSFQLIIIDHSDRALNDFDMEFNYQKIQWETGDASGGTNGFGGYSARAGYSNGTGRAGTFYEVEGSGANGAFLDSNPNGLIYREYHSGLQGGFLFRVEGGQPEMPIIGAGLPLVYAEPGCTINWDPNSGWAPDSNNIEDDPNFVFGYYLAQGPAGQDSNSPCIDIGSDTAEALGLNTLTTRADGVVDGVNDVNNIVDLGYHYSTDVRRYELRIDMNNPPDVNGTIEAPWLPGNTYQVYENIMVRLHAIPNVNCRVAMWIIDDTVYETHNQNFTLIMDSNKHVIVRFEYYTPKNLIVPDEYENIQDAIDAAESGDTIYVYRKTNGQPHYITGPNGLDFKGKAIKIRSEDPNDPNVVTQTIIDCNNGGRAFIFQNGEDANSIIEGFTITNCSVAGSIAEGYQPEMISYPASPNYTIYHGDNATGNGYGGAIYCDVNTCPIIRNCIFSNCEVTGGRGNNGRDGYGLTTDEYTRDEDHPRYGEGGRGGSGSGNGYGGVFFCGQNSSPLILNCTISNCTARGGIGGDGGNGSDGTANKIGGDGGNGGNGSGRGYGSAIYAAAGANPKIIRCNFLENTASQGLGGQGGLQGAGLIPDDPPYPQDGSDGASIGAGFGGAIYYETGATADINDCNFANNTTQADISNMYDTGGGAIYSERNCAGITISKSNMTGNSATQGSGGAIWSGANNNIKLTDCYFGGNTATDSNGDGGALAIGETTDTNLCVLDFNNCAFTDNIAGNIGGAITAKNFNATFVNCYINRNTASAGGGLYLISERSTAKIHGGAIMYNRAIGTNAEGGGAFISNLPLEIINCQIMNNTSLFSGGGIMFRGPSTTTSRMHNCLFAKNSANARGGAVFIALNSSPQITSCSFSENGTEPGGYGGAVLCAYNSSPIIKDCIFDQTKRIAIYESSDDSDPNISYCLFYDNYDGDFYDRDSGITYKTLNTSDPNVNIDALNSATAGNNGAGSRSNPLSPPLFVTGDLGEYYLSQKIPSAPDDTDSLAIDAGSALAANVSVLPDNNMADYTTRIDSGDASINAGDAGQLDIGYHYIDIEANKPGRFNLTTAAVGGHGNIAPPSGQYYAGTTVELTAIPDAGWRVNQWAGTDDDSSTNITNYVVMIRDRQVTVSFEQPKNLYVPGEYTSLQNAVNDAKSGDKIILAKGIYAGSESNYDPAKIIINGKNITITGTNPDDPCVVAETILQGNGFRLANVDRTMILDGISIQDAHYYGGYIDCSPEEAHGPTGDGRNGGSIFGGAMNLYNASPTIRNCQFIDCSALASNGCDGTGNEGDGGWAGWARGGAVAIDSESNPLFKNCAFIDCYAQGSNGMDGAGRRGHGGNWGDPNDNAYHTWDFGPYQGYWYYSGYGGAIYCMGGSKPEFEKCLFQGNRAYGGVCGISGTDNIAGYPMQHYAIDSFGGAVYMAAGSEANFTDCDFVDNEAHTRGQIAGSDPNVPNPDTVGVTIEETVLYDSVVSYGGAVCAEGTAIPVFKNCAFINNRACAGGGMYWEDSIAHISRCYFENCTSMLGGAMLLADSNSIVFECDFNGNLAIDPAGQGGAIYCASSDAKFYDCEIINNEASTSGGGVYFSGELAPSMHNCLIIHNNAGRDGGGISSNWDAQLTLSNCTIAHNIITGGGFATGMGGGLSCAYEADTKVINSIIWSNNAEYGPQISVGSPSYAADKLRAEVSVWYSDVEDGAANVFVDTENGCILNWDDANNLTGTTLTSPLFVTGYWGDYYLSQIITGEPLQTVDSNCVNSGSSPAIDNDMYRHTTRTDHVTVKGMAIDSGIVDMGYHYTLTADILGDFNFDGIVDDIDAGLFFEYWMRSGCIFPYFCHERDITEDGEVDFEDFAAFAANYGDTETVPPKPDPMTWAIRPHSADITKITMTATTARDNSGSSIQYYFDCVYGSGHDQPWGPNSTYTDTGLTIGVQYGYRVKAKDEQGNETDWSIISYAVVGQDDAPPQPDPMLWAIAPHPTSSNSISMTAATATDACGPPEYYFDCVSPPDCHDCDWQASETYEDLGLEPNTTYTYRVKARDKSPAQNETAYSIPASATTPPPGEEPNEPNDTTPPQPNPSTWASVPQAVQGLDPNYPLDWWYHIMTATTATDDSGVVWYYFDCYTSSGTDSGWIDTPYYRAGPYPNTNHSGYRVYTKDKYGNTTAPSIDWHTYFDNQP